MSARFGFAMVWLLAVPCRHMVAQAPAAPDSSTPFVVPQLAGKWLVTSPQGSPFVLDFEQEGTRLSANLVESLVCGTVQVTLRARLWGMIEGRRIQLRAGESRIDGNSQSACNDIPVISDILFVGSLSADNRTIRGPYDKSGSNLHVWTMRRPKK